MCAIRKASSPVANNVFIVDIVFIPLLILFVFVELINYCPFVFELFSFIFDEIGNEIVDVSDVIVVVRIVECVDDENVGTIRPCQTESL
jgi:hypothetical protein